MFRNILKFNLFLLLLCAFSLNAVADNNYPSNPVYPPTGYSSPQANNYQPAWQANIAQQQVPIHQQVVTVGQRQAGVSTILGGTVVPYRLVSLNAEMPGRIEFIAGREGDRFSQGEVLVAVDDDKLFAKREQVVANLNNAQLNVRNSQMQYGREWWAPQSQNINRMPGMSLPALFDQFFTRPIGSSMGYGNPWLERYTDLYSSGTQMGQAQGQYLAALSQLREIDARLRDTRTISPFDGVIIKKMVEAGDTVQPGQPLLQFADLRDLQLSVEVPSRLFAGIQPGMVVPAILDFNNQYVNARVAQVHPIGHEQRHTITVKFDLPVGTQVWPGTYAEIMLPDHRASTDTLIEIPQSAIIKRGSLPIVYVVKNNRRELRLIRLGASYAQGRVTVLAGLQPGEQILLNPSPGVISGEHKAQ